MHTLLFVEKKLADFDDLMAEYKKAAQKYKGRSIFGYIDINLPESESLLGFFEVKRDQVPTVRLLSTDQMAKYAPEFTEVNAANVEAFVQDFFDGKLRNTDVDLNAILYEIRSVSDLKSLQRDATTLVLGLFKNPEGENVKIYKDFINQQTLQDIKYSSTYESSVYEELKLKADEDFIVVFKKSDKLPHQFKGKFDITEIKKFVYLKHLPNVIDLNQKVRHFMH